MGSAFKTLLVAHALALLGASSPAFAQYRLCALRDGPQGPCTCEVEAGKAGEYMPVDKKWCRKAAPKPETTAAPATPAVTPSGAAASRSSAPAAAPQTATAPKAKPAETGAVTPGTAPSSRLAEIRARGKLNCGVNPNLLGFSMLNSSGRWAGLDVDFCRAVATAVFGDAGKVEFVPLETSERFEALQSGKIDLLSRNTTWTMERDVALGLEFAGVLYLDGQGFLTSDERGLVSAQQLAGSKVCVEAGTTSAGNMDYYFKSHGISVEMQTYPTRAELVAAYQSGACDAYSGDRTSLFSDRAGFPEPAKHAVLPEVISKEPLGPAVLQGDRGWAEIVRWTLAGLINAEEVGLDKTAAAGTGEQSADIQRLIDGAGASGEKLGLQKSWLRDTIATVGNYGEMFDASVGRDSPLGMERGINALWKRGGILYAPPMW